MLRYYSLNIAGQSVSLWFIAVPLYLLIAIVCFTLSIRAYLSITEFVFTLELKLPSLNKNRQKRIRVMFSGKLKFRLSWF